MNRILEEQRRARDYILAYPDGDEIRGAKQGCFDWVAEEVLLLVEQQEATEKRLLRNPK